VAILWLLLSGSKDSEKSLLLSQTEQAIELDMDRGDGQMKRVIAIVGLCVFLVGCGSTNWVKTSGYTDPSAAFNDEYECEMMAKGIVPIGPKQEFERDKTYQTMCNQVGNNMNCNTVETEWGAGPAEAGAALGRAIRTYKQRSKFKDCMRSRGYVSDKELEG